LEDQGWLALGYYHQKADRFKKIAEHKAKKQTASSLEGTVAARSIPSGS
jgi:hypothetical protein